MENIWTYCKSAINRFNTAKIWMVALSLFLINLVGYTGFRYLISNDIFGGDTVNTAVHRMDSYTLKHSNFISDPSLFYAMILSGKNKDPKSSPNAFIYSLLSPKGREALERLAKDPTNALGKEIFLLEFNRSVIDKEIDWPKSFNVDSLGDPNLRKAGKLYYNLQVLSRIYPNNIRDNLHPLFQWKYDLPSLIKTLPKMSFAYFTIDNPTRYSPLGSIYTAVVQMYLQNSPERIIIAIVLTGIIYATLMMFVFLMAVKLIKSIPWAVVSVFLFQSSVSTIISTYPLFSLPYMFVPLVMVAAIYAYLQYKDRGGIGWLMLFFYLAIIAPWFREFPGAIPFIVFASEIMSFKGRRSIVILLVSIPLMLHSIYPSLLPWFIGINRGGVYNVLSQGNVQHVANVASLNWYFNGLLFVQFPPALWIIVIISIGYWLWRSPFTFGILKYRVSKIIISSFFISLLLVIVSLFVYSFFIANRNIEHFTSTSYGQFLLGLILFITLVSFRFNAVIPVYFAGTFIPFLRLGLAELHLAFTLIPLAVIFTLWIRDLFTSITNGYERGKRPIVFLLLFGLFIIGLADHFLNMPSAALAQKRMVETNKAMAAWLKNNTTRHSIVVTNFYNFTDVFYYSNYHFDPYETVENCPMGPTQVVHNNKDFENLLNKNLGIRDVYLLAAEHEFRDSSSKYYHSHKYVRNPPGEIEKLAEFSAKTTYYYIDPIKYFVPRYFVSFIGYMDWSIDFYYDNTSTLFKRIVYADYLLYKLKDISKGFNADERPQPSVGAPPHLAGSYQGYNIVDYMEQFYAVPQSLGPLDLSRDADRNRKGILVGKDRRETERFIDKEILNQEKNVPPILAGDYKGYNIVKYGGQFYGVPQSLGPLDLSKEEDRKRKEIIISKDRKEIERLIEKAIQSRTKAQPKVKAVGQPPHLAGAYKEYNIVDYNNSFYGVPQSTGPLDLSKKEDRGRKGILVGKDRRDVEYLIDKAIQSQIKVKAVDSSPHLAGSYQGYNIVDYKGSFYAVPQSVGSLDLSKEENKNRAGLLIGKERKEVEQMIDKAILNQEKAADLSPRLVRSYKGYNIVEYNNRFYGVPQSLGTLDLHKEEDRNRDGILIGKDVKEVKTLIKKHLGYFISFYWKIKDVFNKK